MPEITAKDVEEVAGFLATNFGVPDTLARKYAVVAEFLSDEKRFGRSLEHVDAWLSRIHETALKEGAYRMAPGDEEYHKDKDYNVTSRLLNAAANSLGWGTGGNLVLSGFTHPPDFVRIVQRKLMWKDMVASGHGEFTHIIQWLVIYTEMGPEATGLYGASCDYSCQGGRYSRGEKRYLWDFVVDCFPAPPTADWDAEPRSGTARSPTCANAAIFKTRFLGDRLRDRYLRKGYKVPTDGSVTYPGTAKHGHEKHFKPGVEIPAVSEANDPRATRHVVEAARGYKALQSTGYKGGPNTQHKVEKSGFLFARPDRALQQGSSLMMIAQQHALL
ncbi:LirA/MavJ family T4SS effector [Rubrivivax sp. RP6-9]|uniref:LirA/MavJ family T4SS effector n=1 Tax=Rubrivivax sp. RP6-9 TaxID=3415750 RepID=UPI003CC6B78B